MSNHMTIQRRMRSVKGLTTGFDYLRIGLCTAVLFWHSIWISTGSAQLDEALWTSPLRFLAAIRVPMFFALSGFLVTGSLERNRLHHFALLRALRLIPGLAFAIIVSALLMGLIFTDLSSVEYLRSQRFYLYFLNIFGIIQHRLPGVFDQNPAPGILTGQLWTIPVEMLSYLLLMILSVLTIVRRRFAFAAMVVGLILAFSMWSWSGHPVQATGHLPSRVMIISFLAGVTLYIYRDVVPYSRCLGLMAGILASVLLQIPAMAFLATFPVAYFTIWIGMMCPPKIPFGDLSYGVYLFHFPIEQMIIHMAPGVQSWWFLSIISLPLTVICAWFSWNFVEKPVLSRKRQILTQFDRFWEPMMEGTIFRVWSERSKARVDIKI